MYKKNNAFGYLWFIVLEALLLTGFAATLYNDQPLWCAASFLFGALTACAFFYCNLRRVPENFFHLFENVALGIAFFDRRLLLRSWSKYFARLFDYDDMEISGKQLAEFIHPDSKGPMDVAGLLVLNNVFEGETFIKNKRGDKMPAHIGVSAVLDKRGEALGYLCYLYDLSKQKELTRELMQTGKLAAVGELAAGVAHEVNNPLGTIVLNAEMLLEDLEASAACNREFFQKCLQLINEQAFRCQKIIQRLVDFSRKQSPTLAEFNIHNLLKEALEMLAYEIRAKNITLEYDLQLPTGVIVSDQNQLMQVLLHIISNAADASFKGSVISVRSRLEGTAIVIEVQDYGNGIKPEDLDRVFDPFYTTKAPGKGTGLGLPICRKLLNNLGGEIKLESEYGGGVKAIIYLPFKLSERMSGNG